jgi:hypothetical protein
MTSTARQVGPAASSAIGGADTGNR